MARVPWALLLLVGACHAQFVAQVHIEPTVDPTSVYAAIQTFSGPAEQGVNPSGHADGPGQGARYYEPAGVAAAGIDGTVYVADVRNHVIRKVYWTGWAETYAGLAGRYGLADGTGEAARFHNPSAVSVGPDGEVYVADTGNHAVRVVSATRLVTTLFAARSYATAEARMGAGVPMGLWNPGGEAGEGEQHEPAHAAQRPRQRRQLVGRRIVPVVLRQPAAAHLVRAVQLGGRRLEHRQHAQRRDGREAGKRLEAARD